MSSNLWDNNKPPIVETLVDVRFEGKNIDYIVDIVRISSISMHVIPGIPDCLLLGYKMGTLGVEGKFGNTTARFCVVVRGGGDCLRPRIWDAVMRKFPILKTGNHRILA